MQEHIAEDVVALHLCLFVCVPQCRRWIIAAARKEVLNASNIAYVCQIADTRNLQDHLYCERARQKLLTQFSRERRLLNPILYRHHDDKLPSRQAERVQHHQATKSTTENCILHIFAGKFAAYFIDRVRAALAANIVTADISGKDWQMRALEGKTTYLVQGIHSQCRQLVDHLLNGIACRHCQKGGYALRWASSTSHRLYMGTGVALYCSSQAKQAL